MSAEAKKLNLAELSDEEISNLDPDTLEGTGEEKLESDDRSEEVQSAGDTEVEDTAADESGGAASEDDSPTETVEAADSASAEEETENATEAQTAEDTEQTSEADQASDAGSEESAEPEAASDEVDYKAEFSKVMAPFRAAKREITINNIDDARRLMQMGVDYTRKMEQMKPYRRILKTLQQADLVNEHEINFLIDLHRKDPEAIKKFLKDSEIDPMDLNLEGDNDYTPTDHMVSESILQLDDIIDEIRDTPNFERAIDVVTKQWDRASRELLLGNPVVLRYISQHMDAGLYDQIANKVATERTFGRLQGMSDLDAYKKVGDAMHENGEFIEPNAPAPEPAGNTPQGGGHPSGSDPAEIKRRKRAASPTKGTAGTGKSIPDFSKMTDEQIEQFDVNTL
jgi:hypothetical protein